MREHQRMQTQIGIMYYYEKEIFRDEKYSTRMAVN